MTLTQREENVKSDILSRLGAPVVKVEIDDSQWEPIFRKSKKWFSARKGVMGYAAIPINAEIGMYDFPEDADAILDVVLPLRSDIQSLMSLGFFDIVPLNAMNIGAVTSAFNSYSSYVQILQSLEIRRRVFGAEPDWMVQGRKIILTSKSAGTDGSGLSGNMLVFYTKKTWSLDELDARDSDLVERHVKNEAMYVLSKIRGKYKSYPSAGGGVDMDSDELKADYETELEKLEEEVQESQGPVSFIVG